MIPKDIQVNKNRMIAFLSLILVLLIYFALVGVTNSERHNIESPVPAANGTGQTTITEEEVAPMAVSQYAYDVPLPDELIEYTVDTADFYGINPALVFAVMKVESNFDCLAKSSDGSCYGVMQINSINYEKLKTHLSINNLMDARENIKSGCFILSDLLDKYPLERALVCYNCGENANDYQSTEYSRNVLKYSRKYQL